MLPAIRLAAVLWFSAAEGARAACTIALVLGLDVSASVDAEEYRLQAEGTAAALLAPRVEAAILDGGPVALAIFTWSGPDDQGLVADWVLIDSRATLEALALRVAAFPRPVAVSSRTATGSAILFARGLLDRAPPCDRQVIDLSTDGTFNAGPAPEDVRSAAAFAETTINALAVAGGPVPDWRDVKDPTTALAVYLTFRVIHGPGAFVERAADYTDFARAMTRKLERELQGALLGALEASSLP
ncbi:DUF1194 domain-containing protein [Tabrizicola sp.]|uniref:DUF1194 domain-containing protein n=1 Tax=Tabrizicola sp. TaxID=2005166 RepID=UPI003F3A824B